MKKTIALLLIAGGIFSTQFVQAQQPRSQRMNEMKQKMKDDLKLTDAQADSVSAIQQEFRPKMRDIYTDQTLSADEKKTRFASLRDSADVRIKAVLGDDQFKKYTEWRETNRPQRREQQ